MKITEKINTLAGAIRSRAREYGENPNNLDAKAIADFAEAQNLENPNSIAGIFYRDCTDAQWDKVVKSVQTGKRY